ncbi:putative transporter small subunit [Ruania suaedae]|nr:putative transporter small subunit [Ruania suaedae]UFU03524.1 putative transporter small subunit [Ruania suaedae]
MDFSALIMTLYILVWPVIVAGTLFVIVRSFTKEARAAKRDGRTMI